MRPALVLAAIAIMVALVLGMLGIIPLVSCPLHSHTGIYCVACGTTTAWILLFHGQVRQAFYANPLFLLWGFWTFLAWLDLLIIGIWGIQSTKGPGSQLLRYVTAHRIYGPIQVLAFLLIFAWLNLR